MERIDGPSFEVQRDPRQMNALALAYIGDSIYEVYVRQYLLALGEIKPHQLHRAATQYVSAKAQSEQLQLIWELLDEGELSIVRRGRNAKSGSMPKNALPADYHMATAFEALLGYHYLLGNKDRLYELIEYAVKQNAYKREE